MSGLEGQAEQIIHLNPQLARLFGSPIRLSPFEWDLNKPKTKSDFIKFLGLVEGKLPLREKSDLTSEEIAWRCFAACRGRVGFLMTIIREASHKAIETKKEKIDIPILEWAFNKRFVGTILGIDNPFVGPAPKNPLPSIKSDNLSVSKKKSSKGKY